MFVFSLCFAVTLPAEVRGCRRRITYIHADTYIRPFCLCREKGVGGGERSREVKRAHKGGGGRRGGKRGPRWRVTDKKGIKPG
ncbi:hypothetical protein TRSC58_07573 [Trypanosoma rangeli SC58]|uniref:Secreted protein n=1 Tax=Trypanosoma rangeli SC58 TaxID=429131 RepID=A0A061IUZ4_TRYRA|nr:hypothetical protein TRSC58_07573 [Trypanosoma rangeli SC58]